MAMQDNARHFSSGIGRQALFYREWEAIFCLPEEGRHERLNNL
jgi:hypothetical protein